MKYFEKHSNQQTNLPKTDKGHYTINWDAKPQEQMRQVNTALGLISREARSSDNPKKVLQKRRNAIEALFKTKQNVQKQILKNSKTKKIKASYKKRGQQKVKESFDVLIPRK